MENFVQIASTIAFALIVNALSPQNTLAATFDVFYDVTIDQFSPPSGAFGVNPPTQVSFYYQIDTDVAPVVFIPSGTQVGTSFPYEHDLYGYDVSAISPFSISFGTEDFDNNDLKPLFFTAAHSNVGVYFDEPLTDEATPRTKMILRNEDNSSFFFGFSKHNPATGLSFLENSAAAVDVTSAGVNGEAVGELLEVRITAVPIPASLPLFGCAFSILGVIGTRRRKNLATFN